MKEDYADYEKRFQAAQHLVVKPGDVVPLKGVNVDVLTSAGDRIQAALPGAGAPNPSCCHHPKERRRPHRKRPFASEC